MVLSFELEMNGENRFVRYYNLIPRLFVSLVTSSMQICRRRTYHVQWDHVYGRKKLEKARGAVLYIDTDLQSFQPLVLGQT